MIEKLQWWLEHGNVATGVTVVIVAGAATVGGVVTITHPESLSFQGYLETLQGLAVATGVLGVGRGLLGRKAPAQRSTDVPPPDAELDETYETHNAPTPPGIAPIVPSRKALGSRDTSWADLANPPVHKAETSE